MENNELITIEKINAIELFTGKNVDPLIKEIREKALDFEPDISTAKGRKDIASQAYKVAQSKTMLDNLGKDLVSDWKKKSKAVDDSRKAIRDALDQLKDEVRKPLTDWEEEQKRIEEEKKALEQFLSDWSDTIHENELFDRQREIERKEAELKRIEEERRAKEEAARIEKERIDREERLKKEAAEKARLEAEEKARKEREDLIRKEEQARLSAEKAERDRKEAVERAEREKQEAIENERRKAEEERLKKEREQKAKEEAERIAAEKKAAHWKHQKAINNEALADFEQNGIDTETAKSIISLIAKGLISHITINY